MSDQYTCQTCNGAMSVSDWKEGWFCPKCEPNNSGMEEMLARIDSLFARIEKLPLPPLPPVKPPPLHAEMYGYPEEDRVPLTHRRMAGSTVVACFGGAMTVGLALLLLTF